MKIKIIIGAIIGAILGALFGYVYLQPWLGGNGGDFAPISAIIFGITGLTVGSLIGLFFGLGLNKKALELKDS